ncbi:MAG: MarR family winged helix-turn-helix transcriptional regulator, partial [Solirubrobacteraceae bacterium]
AVTVGDRAGDAMAAAEDIGTTQAAALITLDNYAAGMPLTVLGDALRLSHAAVVRLADRLQDRGLVERRAGAGGDRRAVGLELTAAGRRAIRALRSARAAALEDALAPLDAREREVLEDLLAKVLAAETRTIVDSQTHCRLCDGDACGHPARCPVTQAAPSIS